VSWRDQPRDKQGRWTKRSGGFLVSLALVLGFAAAGGSAAGAGGAASAVSAAERSVGGTQARGSRSKGRAQDRSTARVVQRLKSRGLRVNERGVDASHDCVAHSYGQVQQFFRQHPCTAVYRALLEVHDRQATVLLAVAWVDMPDEAQALQYKRLVDRHGTGNITELTKEGGPYARVQWTGNHYASTIDGATVVNVQAEPVGRTAQLTRLAEVAAQTTVE
jgi:hypothetical protein